MNLAKKVSEAEFEILKLIWEKGEAMSSAEINELLKQSMGWEKSTVRTLVHRLTEKGVLLREQREMFYYSCAITEKEYLEEQTKGFLERMYRGNAKSLVASLFEQDYIRPGDIDELKRFWKEGERGHVE